jgi:hypothetical protein
VYAWLPAEQAGLDADTILAVRTALSRTVPSTAWVSGRLPRRAVAGSTRPTVAMKMVGHKTEAIYRRYAIVDEAMLREGGGEIGTRCASLETAGVIR